MSPGLITRLRSSVFAFPLAALAALGMLFISETSYNDATGAFAHLVGRGQARIELQTLRRNLYEAESGQRGYLLTGRPDHLVLYRASVPSARGALSSLARFYTGDTETGALIARLTQVTEEKFAEVQSTLDAYDQGRTGDWQAVLRSNVGTARIEEARALSDQLLTLENARIRAEREGVLQTLMLNRIGIGAMTAVSLLALFMYLRQTAELDRQVSDENRRVAHERDRLEAEVAARTTQLKELAQHLQTIREDERSHLARELHDELGALLTAAKLDVARLKSRLGATTPEIIERLAHLNEALNNGIALKRRIIENLRPSSLSNLGLVSALEILLREWSERSEITVESALSQPLPLEPAVELTIFRLVQEALTNVAKYASATHVFVDLGAAGSAVKVAVRDDGVGFDTTAPRLQTHGLIGMRFRVEADGGELRVESEPGGGTLIEATLPALDRDIAQELPAVERPNLVLA